MVIGDEDEGVGEGGGGSSGGGGAEKTSEPNRTVTTYMQKTSKETK